MFIKEKFIYLKTEEGQGLVEYALILVLIALVVIVVLSFYGQALGGVFSNIVDWINPLPTPVP